MSGMDALRCNPRALSIFRATARTVLQEHYASVEPIFRKHVPEEVERLREMRDEVLALLGAEPYGNCIVIGNRIIPNDLLASKLKAFSAAMLATTVRCGEL